MDVLAIIMVPHGITPGIAGHIGRLFCCLLPAALEVAASSWPQYRGPDHNGISTDLITTNWTGSVTNPVWLVYLTNGLTSLTVSDGRVYTQVARNTNGGNMEICLALDADNGVVLWSTPVDVADYPDGGVGFTDDGPRTTPVVDGESVFVLTSYLKLYRLDATNGAVIWSTNLLSGFGGSVIQWQNAASPVIEDGLLFVNANCGTSTLMAFNASDGSLIWRSQDEAMTHSTPVLASIHGVRQLIFATQSGLVSLDPQTGDLIWKFTYPFSYSLSLASSPVVHDDIVFITGLYGMSSVAARIMNSNSTLVATQLWRNVAQASHWATPVAHRGHLFGQFTPDNANAELRCLDLETGTQKWAVGGFGRGSTLLAGTNLLVATERGDLVLVGTDTNTFVEHARFQAIPNFNTDGNKCWNALAVSDGRVYVRSTAYAACYDLSLSWLKLDPPVLANQRTVQLTVKATTAEPLTGERVAGLTLRYSADVSLPMTTWTPWPGALALSNGVAICGLPLPDAEKSWFVVSEPALTGPALELDPPNLFTQRALRLTIRTTNGKPLTPERVAAMQLQFTTNPSLPVAAWPIWPGPIVLSNGLGLVSNIPVQGRAQQWFLVSESE